MATLAIDNNPIKNGVVLAWNEINDILIPIIGQHGVDALYQRSLALTYANHAWLADTTDMETGPEKFTAL